jgi:hypothetical protein
MAFRVRLVFILEEVPDAMRDDRCVLAALAAVLGLGVHGT